ncbi:UPF0182 family protein [Balneolaceae bacterium ANBcel3]|nr:UPF0182 family protein [Balneolaceae bacterium ANBcel3]
MRINLIRLLLLILIPVLLLIMASSQIMEWLWLNELGYSHIFIVLKSTRVLLFIGALVLSFLYLKANFRLLAKHQASNTFFSLAIGNMNLSIPAKTQEKWIGRIMTLVAVFISAIFSAGMMLRWDDVLRFIHNKPFGHTDPVFGLDISFFMFQLPFLDFLQSAFTALAFFVTLLLAIIYFVTDMISARPGENFRAAKGVLTHIKVNGALWLFFLGIGFFLSRYDLLYREDGVVFGAGYTHIVIEMPALVLLSVLCFLLAILLIISIWVRMPKVLAGFGALAIVVFIGGRFLLPTAVQQLYVAPNELTVETPYIENNIHMTRLAYGLNNVREVDYDAEGEIAANDIRDNQKLIENIRLWDHRLLIQTYRQLQEIRPYYQFNTIGIDRYIIDQERQQVMLAGRELSPRLPDGSNSWLNRHLQYTHGYGIAISPVNQTNRQGEPVYLSRDLPPVTHPDIHIDNAAIYYGKYSYDYHIVNTRTEELHYPGRDGNVYHHYTGTGGIPVSGFFKRLLFSWYFSDINILLSDYILPESRLQVWRGVQDRIDRIAPFLQLDEDPYLVVHDGRLVWIQDAYTTSSRFPYSEPHRSINYIRNPVKVVVDAYDGSVDFYIIDDSDPIVQIYASIFPGLFKTADEVPESLDHHFRYPVNLFETQLEVYSRYHMTQPRIFYNDEDRWRRPFEHYAGRRVTMEPYYVLGNLPDRQLDDLEFKLISPLTPEGRNNMIGWMAARSDPEYYGELVVFRLPKDRLIFGPAQIESRIDQDPEISRQLALWDQRGSRVIRGNLLVIPIENSFIYVEPVFLLADRDDIPQLQRVIVSVGDQISMQPTIQAAMLDLFGEDARFLDVDVDLVSVPSDEELLEEMEAPLPVQDPMVPQPGDYSQEQLDEIRSLWGELREAMRDENWGRYGEILDELDQLLN